MALLNRLRRILLTSLLSRAALILCFLARDSADLRCLIMLKSLLLTLVLCMCASPSSGVRQIHESQVTQDTQGFFGRSISPKFSRYDPADETKLNAIIDGCGGERHNQCIRMKCEATWPDKKHWEVIDSTVDDTDADFGYTAIKKKMFMKFRYRVLFKYNVDTRGLFIMADPIPRH